MILGCRIEPQQLIISPASHSMRRWVVRCALPVSILVNDEVVSITIPRGFRTDFASVPRVFYGLLPPTGRYGLAALVHDYLYATKVLTRRQADQVFLHLMKSYGVNKVVAVIMYRASRWFGRQAWKNAQQPL